MEANRPDSFERRRVKLGDKFRSGWQSSNAMPLAGGAATPAPKFMKLDRDFELSRAVTPLEIALDRLASSSARNAPNRISSPRQVLLSAYMGIVPIELLRCGRMHSAGLRFFCPAPKKNPQVGRDARRDEGNGCGV